MAKEKRRPEAEAEEAARAGVGLFEAESATTGGEGAEDAKYQANPVVNERPAKCPRCGGMNRRIVYSREFPDRPIYVDGTLHRGLLLSRRVCLDCRRRYIVTSPLIRKAAEK